MDRRFGATYLEDVTLRDGAVARLRLVRPEDKPLLADGFSNLSPQSRYLRFFTGKDHLSAAELRYLTELDGDKHLAIGAMTLDGAHGLAVARFIRLAAEPEVAELAVAVIDSAQRKGLGRLLCERIIEAARERGVRRFRAEVLPSNAAMMALVRGLAAAVQHEEAGTLVVDFELPPVAPDAPRNLVAELLELAARGLIAVRRVFDRSVT